MKSITVLLRFITVLLVSQGLASSMDPEIRHCEYMFCDDCRMINGVPKCFDGNRGPHCPEFYMNLMYEPTVRGSNNKTYPTMYHLVEESCLTDTPIMVVDDMLRDDGSSHVDVDAPEHTPIVPPISSNSTIHDVANGIGQVSLNRAVSISSIQEELEQMSKVANSGIGDRWPSQ